MLKRMEWNWWDLPPIRPEINVKQDIPAYHLAAGNPARIIRRIKTSLDPEQVVHEDEDRDLDGAEGPMKELAENIENRDT